MGPDPRRKYVPAESYRLMLLAALRHRDPGLVSKGTLASETRSSHYAITKALSLLVEERLVQLEGSPLKGYTIQLSAEGAKYCERHRSYIVEALRAASVQQFRYGPHPLWLDRALALSSDPRSD